MTPKAIQLTPLSLIMSHDLPEPEYLVDGILLRQALTIVAGRPKSGKSTILRNLMVAIANGGTFLGQQCKRGSSFYFSFEDNNDSLVKAKFKDLNCSSPDLIHVHTAGIAHVKGIIDELAEEIDQYRPQLIVIDPVIKFRRCEDINDYGQVYGMLEPFLEMVKKFNLHIILVHHTSKTGADTFEGIMGSTAWLAAADGAFLVARSGELNTIRSQQRFGGDLTETYFKLNSGVISEFGPYSSLADKNIDSRIIELLERHIDGRATEAILQAIPNRRELVRQRLQDLASRGQITSQGSGKKNDPQIWRIQFPTMDC